MHSSPANPAAYPPEVSRGSGFADYFAYGSNMSGRYLSNVRNVQVQASYAAALPGYRLAFNLPGVIPLEPAFANLISDVNATVYGVVHRIAIADFRKIFASELDAYGLTTVEVQAPDLASNATLIPVQTLISPSSSPDAMPSRRYLRLLIAGAQEHGLPAGYIEELRDRKGLYIPVLSECAGTYTKARVYWNARKKLHQGRGEG